MATKSEPSTYTVLGSFVGRVGDEDVFFRAGDTVAAGHPALRKWPDLFKAQEPSHGAPTVEQATAAPGEKRGR